MKIGYTEFSFGYAFTENLIRSSVARPAGAPVFPNLVQEGLAGYDVHIDLPGCPIFFQYKLPELMVRNNAAEISQYGLRGIAVPFFRMPLMRRDLSSQHQLLIDLEQNFTDAVYYATPAMQNIRQFNSAYNAAQVHQLSVFFSPGDIGPLPDDKAHVVAYRNGLDPAWFCSEPRQVSALNFEDLDQKVSRLLDDARFKRLDEGANIIQSELLKRVSPEIESAVGAIRERKSTAKMTVPDGLAIDDETRRVTGELLVSREIARVGLGLDMVIAQRAS